MSSILQLNYNADTLQTSNEYLPKSSSISNSSVLSSCAKIVHRAVSHCYIRHSAKRVKDTMENHAYCVRSIQYLSNLVAPDTCNGLLLESESRNS